MLDPLFWKDKNVFITGHTGFKGGWMTVLLKTLGANVSGYSLGIPTTPSLFEVNHLSELLEKNFIGDIVDREHLKRAMQDSQPHVVIHLAAQPLVRESYADPFGTYRTNVMGTLSVLECVKQVQSVKACIIATTDKVYLNEERKKAYSEEDRLGGHDPYASSKACTEILTSSFIKSFLNEEQVRVSTVRAGNVIGGGDWAKDRIMVDMVAAASQNAQVTLRNPNAVRPWQHVLEPVAAYLKIAELNFKAELKSDSFNIGPEPDSERSVDFVARQFYSAWGLAYEPKKDTESHPHEATLLTLDISKAKKVLKWKPRYSLNQAIENTAKWYQHWLKGDMNMLDLTRMQVKEYLELF